MPSHTTGYDGRRRSEKMPMIVPVPAAPNQIPLIPASIPRTAITSDHGYQDENEKKDRLPDSMCVTPSDPKTFVNCVEPKFPSANPTNIPAPTLGTLPSNVPIRTAVIPSPTYIDCDIIIYGFEQGIPIPVQKCSRRWACLRNLRL